MIRKASQLIPPVALVFVIACFISTISWVDANPCSAASSIAKAPIAGHSSAIDTTEAHIAQLQVAMMITKDQEALWNNLVQVMRENAQEMDTIAKDRSNGAKKMNAVDRLNLHAQIIETHFHQLQKFIPPFDALYASMSDEQKKRTDILFQKGMTKKYRNK